MEGFAYGSEVHQWRAEAVGSPLPVVEKSVESALDRLGVTRQGLTFTDLELKGGTAFLPLGETWPAESRKRLTTMDVDVFKSWIGFQNPEGLGLAPDFPAETPAADLGRRYIFGDSRGMDSYKQQIEESFAPFEAILITAGRIELRDSSRLVLRGFPTILVAEELVIEQGSSVLINVHSHLTVGRLIKLGGSQ